MAESYHAYSGVMNQTSSTCTVVTGFSACCLDTISKMSLVFFRGLASASMMMRDVILPTPEPVVDHAREEQDGASVLGPIVMALQEMGGLACVHHGVKKMKLRHGCPVPGGSLDCPAECLHRQREEIPLGSVRS
jgi:hypothetical protein